ncbi:uncharacterized protein MONOS_1082 [Monocercomonoides exilis]|uniref:uncharacterized protein n=1 Tax=Monocercomonoides exilis TaxID=2049356 RepID=UPI00355A7BCB|nr:hypothetical protein MONOS_1082 [Monocercomonoides exilis]|eukprot:MONOS_1082.1-p1 / transcript=MONOS_1082.1 / gene=MONOS_1082 / organism=Monocercomonoides_exilis_PA203 / gene_product=unspecified product / transcript_product=unspecified product / location=Mono_scaffold00018:125974-138301(-) / protein_length=4091 / sequence_SO=supercontig / SO=protein_coding / is_pseudo=false
MLFFKYFFERGDRENFYSESIPYVFYGCIIHGLSCVSPSTKLSVKLCTFKYCTHTQSSKKLKKYRLVNTDRQDVNDREASFSDCEWIKCSGEKGGAIYFDGYRSVLRNHDLTLNYCIFECCYSGTSGGAVYMKSVDEHSVTGCFYFGSQAANGIAIDTYLEKPDSYYSQKQHTWTNSYTTAEHSSFVVNGKGDYSSKINIMKKQWEISNTGNDERGCGLSSIRCKTIQFAFDQQRVNYPVPMVILNGTFSPTTIVVKRFPCVLNGSNRVFSIISNLESVGTVFSVSGTSFKVSTAKFRFEKATTSIVQLMDNGNCSIEQIITEQPSNVQELNSPCFQIESGILKISNSLFSSLKLASGNALVKAQQGSSVRFSLSNFTSISSSGGYSVLMNTFTSQESFNVSLDGCLLASVGDGGISNGGCLSFQCSSSTSFFVSNTSFSSNVASSVNGKGGALHFSYQQLIPEQCTLKFNEIRFTENVARFGRDFFITVRDLTESITATVIPFALLSESIPDRSNALYGSDMSAYFEPVDLYTFLTGFFSDTIHVSSESYNTDRIFCGSNEYRCSTLPYAVTRFSPSILPPSDSTPNRVLLLSGTVGAISTNLNLTNVECVSQSAAMKATIQFASTLSGDAQTVIASKGKFVVSQLYLSFFPSIRNDASASISTLFSFTEDEALFSSCIFRCETSEQTSVTFSLIAALDSSKLLISYCSVGQPQRLAFSVPAFLFTGNASTINMTYATIENVTSAGNGVGLFECNSSSKEPTIWFSNCRFSKLRGGDQTNCLFSSRTTSSGSVVLDSCTLFSCVADSATKGGAVMWHVSSGGKIQIASCDVRSCSTETELRGRGGGIYILLDDSESDFLVSSVTFSANKAFLGKDMYIEYSQLDQASNLSKYQSVFSPTFDFDNSVFGSSHESDAAAVDIIDEMRYRSQTVYITSLQESPGTDWFRCGTSADPCYSLDFGRKQHIRDSIDTHSLVVMRESLIGSETDLSDAAVTSSDAFSFALAFTEEMEKKSGRVISNQRSLVISSASFSLPSSFLRGQKTLFFTEAGSLRISFSTFSATIPNLFLSYVLISAASGSLELSECNFGLNEVTSITSPILSVSQSASISLSLVTFTKFEITGSSFLAAPQQIQSSLASSSSSNMAQPQTEHNLSNCTFNSITSSSTTNFVSLLSASLSNKLIISNMSLIAGVASGSGEGGGMKLTMPTSDPCPSLTIRESVLKDCMCNNVSGKGGFLYLQVGNSDPSFLLSSLTFQRNTAAFGENLYLLGTDLNATVNTNRLGFELSDFVDNRNAFVGSDSTFSSVDLLAFIISFTSDAVVVSSSGFDVKRCGSEIEPCKTFWSGMKRINELSPNSKSILVDSFASICDKYDISNFTVESKTKTGKCAISVLSAMNSPSETSQSIFNNRLTASFNEIDFLLPSCFSTGEEVFVLSNPTNGAVSFGECTFANETVDPILFTLISVESGKLSFEAVSIKMCSFAKPPFCFKENSDVLLEELNMQSIELESSTLIRLMDSNQFCSSSSFSASFSSSNEASSNLILRNTTLKNITSLSSFASPVIFSSTILFSTEISQSTFDRLKSSDSPNGGALKIGLDESTGKLEVNNLRLTNCECSTETGRGGGIYVECCESNPDSFAVSSLFVNSNKAFIGRDLYLFVNNLPNLVSPTTYSFTVLFSDKNNSLIGADRDRFQEEVDLFILIDGFSDDALFIGYTEGSDELSCGSIGRPCQTLDYTLGKLDEATNKLRQISINKIAFLGAPVLMEFVTVAGLFDNATGIRNEEDTVSLLVQREMSSNENYENNGNSIIASTSTLQFKDVTFYIPISFVYISPTSFITSLSSRGSLLLRSCAILNLDLYGNDDTSSFHLISAESGTATLLNFAVKELSFSSSPFFFSQTTQVTLSSVFCDDIGFLSCSLFDSKFSLFSSSSFLSASTAHSSNAAIGFITLESCNFSNIRGLYETSTPCLIGASLLVELRMTNCCCSNMSSLFSHEGGGIKALLNSSGALKIYGSDGTSSPQFSSCECDSIESGRGGFLYLGIEGKNHDFEFSGIQFQNNSAKEGNNIFISSSDLLVSMKTDRFSFPLDLWVNDSNSFVGCDDRNFSNAVVDLLSFLIPFSADSVLVSISGFDLMRCGTENLPCSSFAVGVSRFDTNSQEQKTLLIDTLTTIGASCDMTNCITSSFSDVKASVVFSSALTLSSSISIESYAVLINKNTANYSLLAFSFSKTQFDSGAECVFESSSGDLIFSHCSFASPVVIEFVLVRVLDGFLQFGASSLDSMKFGTPPFLLSPISNSSFVDSSVSSCDIQDGNIIKLLRPSDGCYSSLKSNSECNLKLLPDNSVSSASQIMFSGCTFVSVLYVTVSADLPSTTIPTVLCCDSPFDNINFLLNISDSSFINCSSLISDKGGVFYFTLSHSMSLEVTDSFFLSCQCNPLSGCGGCIYLCGIDTDPLPVFFRDDMFKLNNAKYGKDIFIECLNVSAQISEVNFEMAFDSTSLSDKYLMNGMDNTNHPDNPAIQLLDYVMFYRSSIVYVSSSSLSSLDDGKMCGDLNKPCYSLSSGSTHVHLIKGGTEGRIYVINSSIIEKQMELIGTRVISQNLESATEDNRSWIIVPSNVSTENNCIISCKKSVSFEYLGFSFESLGEIQGIDVFCCCTDGSLSVEFCIFTSIQPEDLILSHSFSSDFQSRISSAFVLPFPLFVSERSSIMLSGGSLSNMSFLHQMLLIGPSSLSELSYLSGNATISLSIQNISCSTISATSESLFQINSVNEVTIYNLSINSISCCTLEKYYSNEDYESNISNNDPMSLFVFANCNSIEMDQAEISDFNLPDFSVFAFTNIERITISKPSIESITSAKTLFEFIDISFAEIEKCTVANAIFECSMLVLSSAVIPEQSVNNVMSHSQLEEQLPSSPDNQDEASSFTIRALSVANVTTSQQPLFSFSHHSANVEIEKINISNVTLPCSSVVDIHSSNSPFLISGSFLSNVTSLSSDFPIISVSSMESTVKFINCSFSECKCFATIGGFIQVSQCSDVTMDLCSLDGKEAFLGIDIVIEFSEVIEDSPYAQDHIVETRKMGYLDEIVSHDQKNKKTFANIPKTASSAVNKSIHSNQDDLLNKSEQDFECTNKYRRKETSKRNYEEKRNEKEKVKDEVCSWNGSVLNIRGGNVLLKDSSITNSSQGGLSIFGGNVTIEDGKFADNSPSIEHYESVRRNIRCFLPEDGKNLMLNEEQADNPALCELNIISLKGGDGLQADSSLWILNEGHKLSGIASERLSPFFIPKISSITVEETESYVNVIFEGSLLLPCNLTYQIIFTSEEEQVIEKRMFSEEDYISEEKIQVTLDPSEIKAKDMETEVSISISFGDQIKQNIISSAIITNKTAPKAAELPAEKKMLPLYVIVIISVVAGILLMCLILVVITVVKKLFIRKKKKNEFIEIDADSDFEDEEEKNIITKEPACQTPHAKISAPETPSSLLSSASSTMPLLSCSAQAVENSCESYQEYSENSGEYENELHEKSASEEDRSKDECLDHIINTDSRPESLILSDEDSQLFRLDNISVNENNLTPCSTIALTSEFTLCSSPLASSSFVDTSLYELNPMHSTDKAAEKRRRRPGKINKRAKRVKIEEEEAEEVISINELEQTSEEVKSEATVDEIEENKTEVADNSTITLYDSTEDSTDDSTVHATENEVEANDSSRASENMTLDGMEKIVEAEELPLNESNVNENEKPKKKKGKKKKQKNVLNEVIGEELQNGDNIGEQEAGDNEDSLNEKPKIDGSDDMIENNEDKNVEEITTENCVLENEEKEKEQKVVEDYEIKAKETTKEKDEIENMEDEFSNKVEEKEEKPKTVKRKRIRKEKKGKGDNFVERNIIEEEKTEDIKDEEKSCEGNEKIPEIEEDATKVGKKEEEAQIGSAEIIETERNIFDINDTKNGQTGEKDESSSIKENIDGKVKYKLRKKPKKKADEKNLKNEIEILREDEQAQENDKNDETYSNDFEEEIFKEEERFEKKEIGEQSSELENENKLENEEKGQESKDNDNQNASLEHVNTQLSEMEINIEGKETKIENKKKNKKRSKKKGNRTASKISGDETE